MTPVPKIPLFGYAFTAFPHVKAVAADILEWAAQPPAGLRETVTTPNAFLVVTGNEKRHRELKSYLSESRWTLADGAPIVLTAKMKGHQLTRLTGSDLFPLLWKGAREKDIPVSLVAASETLARHVQEDYARAYTQVPLFFNENDEAYIKTFAQKVADQVQAQETPLIFLGVKFPKQEKLGRAIQQTLTKRGYKGNTVILLLGASYEFYFGLKKRAPAVWQKWGLEWLYRFGQEPRRLFKRYTVDNFRFAVLMLRELLKGKGGT